PPLHGNNYTTINLHILSCPIAMPVGAGSPTIYAINQPSQKPAPAYVLCGYVKRGRLRFTVGWGRVFEIVNFCQIL
ncbi:hypothetical protein, partial [Microcoleus sp. S13_C3]|uniref:hypothetical protein n=1 Tax=Microcoleus sp. S13_C3 TaxID=3055409 RepID=UPI002FCE901E